MNYKKQVSIILTLAIIFGMMPVQAFAGVDTTGNWSEEGKYNKTWLSEQTNNGDSESTPYIITNAKDLAAFAIAVNSGNTFYDKYVKISDDANIDLSPHFWMPIGISTSDTSLANFRGTFDGNNKLITGLKIGTVFTLDNSLDYLGLFGVVGYLNGNHNDTGKPFGIIKNLGVDVNIYSSKPDCNIGGIAGYAVNATIQNCYATGSITGEGNCGGLVGTNINGLWVDYKATIQNSYASTTVTGGNDACVGGLLGKSYRGLIDNSYAIGNVCGGNGSMSGGLVGFATQNNGATTIINCYATGSVRAGDTYTLSSEEHRAVAGGLIGKMRGAYANNCYSKGDVMAGASADVGGLVGSAPLGYYVYIKNCYSTGNLKGGENSNVGGVLGLFGNDSYKFTNCFWNSDSIQIINGVNQELKKGIGKNEISVETGIENRTSLQMQQSTFVSSLNAWKNDADFWNPSNPEYLYWQSIENDYPIFDLDSSPTSSKFTDYIDIDWLTNETNAKADGSFENPYLIENESQLAAFSAAVNEENDFSGKTIKITRDIDLIFHLWVPVGTADAPFKGILDGNESKITHLYIGTESTTNDDIDNVGLFGFMKDGTVKNVGADVAIYSSKVNAKVGGLIGNVDGVTIQNCYVTGSVNGGNASKVGGLIGHSQNNSKIQNSCATANVIGVGSNTDAGGLVGYNQSGIIQNCYASGIVSDETATNVGGLVGSLGSDEIDFGYWNKDVIATGIGNGTSNGIEEKTAEQLKSTDFLNTLNTNTVSGVTEFKRWIKDSKNNGFPIPTSNSKTWLTEGNYDTTMYVKLIDAVEIPKIFDNGGVLEINNARELAAFGKAILDSAPLSTYIENAFMAYKSVDITKIPPKGAFINVKLMNDINLAGINWEPIGNIKSNELKFLNFDGNNKIISNLKIEGDNMAVGLFSLIKMSKIKNLAVYGNISGTAEYAGGIAGGMINSDIENCISDVDFNVSAEYSGGIVGISGNELSTTATDLLYSNITNSANKGNLEGYSTETNGLCSSMDEYLKINNCYNIGNLPDRSFPIANTFSGNNNYYLDTCVYSASTGSAITGSAITLRTEIYMKSQDFVDDLNSWVNTQNSSTSAKYSLWESISNGYPVFEWLKELVNVPAPEGLNGVAPTSALNDGKIMGTSKDMEYKLSTDSTWTQVTGAEIRDLTAGTYDVRYADKAGFNVGLDATVTVPVYVVAGGDSGKNNGSNNKGVDIQVNGKTETAAILTSTKDGDRTVATIAVDEKKLQTKLNTEDKFSVVTIPFNNNVNIACAQLNGQTVKNMEFKEAVLEIKTENSNYTIPASEINIDYVAEQIGKKVELKDILVNVKISESLQDKIKIVEDIAIKNSYHVVVKPVEFEITCISGNKIVEVSKFNSYIERMIRIPEGIDSNKITTGIVLNADGTFSHVPTIITVIDGKYYAKINSLTNSIYSVIWNQKTFKDVESHWAKDAVNDMGSRLVVKGIGYDMFEPDRDITRAEFATIVVKALGLMRPIMGNDVFKDVEKTDWYYDAVSIANEYHLISGYGDGAFVPDRKITREEAMAIISRAMEVAKMDTDLSDTDIKNEIEKFIDNNDIASWANKSVAACVKNEIVVGNNNMVLAKDYITRAETAAIVRRMLQKAKLI